MTFLWCIWWLKAWCLLSNKIYFSICKEKTILFIIPCFLSHLLLTATVYRIGDVTVFFMLAAEASGLFFSRSGYCVKKFWNCNVGSYWVFKGFHRKSKVLTKKTNWWLQRCDQISASSGMHSTNRTSLPSAEHVLRGYTSGVMWSLSWWLALSKFG